MDDLIQVRSAGLNENQIACAEVLKEALAQVLEGNVDCLGVALCMHGGYASQMAGNRPGELMLAAFDLQCQIRDATQGSPKSAAVNRIVRARSM